MSTRCRERKNVAAANPESGSSAKVQRRVKAAINGNQSPTTMKTPLLFLDFDGVLHPQPDPFRLGQTEVFSCLDVLEAALRGLHYRVVLTTSWRAHFPLDELADMLGSVGPVISATGYLSHMDPLTETHPIRQAEIERWLMFNDEESTPFLVVDDLPNLFAPGWTPLLLIDPDTGLMPEDGITIRERMRALQPAAGRSPRL